MATKTLRPVGDSGSIGHTCSSGSSAYLLIDDATADNDSTYIYQTISSTSATSKTTTVTLGSIFDSTNYTITACRLFCVARRTASNTSSVSVIFKVNGNGEYVVSASSLSNSYTSYNVASANMVNTINQAMQNGIIPEISAVITTNGAMSSSKDSSSAIRVTQIYLEFDYDESVQASNAIFVKENGVWKQYNQVYKKVNNQWVLQSDLSSAFDKNVSYVRGN